MLSSLKTPTSFCLGALCAATLLLAGCGEGAAPAAPPAGGPTAAAATATASTPAPALDRAARALPAEPMPGGGIRLDTRGDGRHVRGLQRQPDGTYRAVCVDAPEALRPRAAATGGGGAR